ncbi:MAG TPA: glycosyltransferase [Chitinophagaceae bacterium]|nr:glycosyltransferase [Chitinophagaceae bacterium]
MKNNTLSTGITLRAYSGSETLVPAGDSLFNDPALRFDRSGGDLTIVILSFNRVSLTSRLIHSVFRCIPGYKGNILIADNGSSAEQIAILEEEIKGLPNIELIKYNRNLGVAGGRNEAMKHVKTSWVLSLDNDIYLIEDPLKYIASAIKSLGAYFINVPLLKPDGKTIDAFGGDLWLEPHGDTYYISGTSSYRQIAKTSVPVKQPFLSTFMFGGASVFYKEYFLKQGGYDDNMFIGFEDTEFSLRLYKQGVKIGNSAGCCFIHAHDAPANDQDKESEKTRFSAKIIKESGEYFRQKHGLIVWKKSIDDWIGARFAELGIGQQTTTKEEEDNDNGLASLLPALYGEPQENENTPPAGISQGAEIEILKNEVQLLRERIRSMESSKFWRLRSRWFSLRKLIGIPDENYSILDKRAYHRRKRSGLTKTVSEYPYEYNRLLKTCPAPGTNGDTVLVFIPFMVIGGAETAMLQVLKGLQKNNIGVTLVASQHSPQESGDTSALFADVCPDHYFLEDYNTLWGDSDHWKHWKALTYEIIKARSVKAILISNSSFGYAMLNDLKQDFPYLKVINPVYSTVGHMIDNIQQERFIDMTVVENPKVEEYLLNVCGRNPQKVKRIENGVDIRLFHKPAYTKPERLNSFAIPAGKKIVTFLGRLSEEKGPDIFLEIAARLKDEPDLHFVIAGGGPMSPQVISLIHQHGLSKVVTFPGFCQAADVLALSTVLVVPSRMDGRPNVVLESLSMGVPVICSDAGGLPWLIAESNRTGYCLSLDNLQDFEKAIKKLTADQALYDSFSASCRQYATAHLDAELMQQQYAGLIKTLVKTSVEEKEIAV